MTGEIEVDLLGQSLPAHSALLACMAESRCDQLSTLFDLHRYRRELQREWDRLTVPVTDSITAF